MSLKKLDDAASRDFWQFVERSSQTWRDHQPRWARDVEHERRSEPDVEREREERQAVRRVG